MANDTSAPAAPTPGPRLQRRALITLGGTLGLYTVSVAAHRGEFWPFSIFPMFSRAGHPWTRALMLDITDQPDEQLGWGPWSREELPAPPIATRRVGASTNDLSKFVQLTDTWTTERVATLRKLWQPALTEGRSLMLLRADGSREDGGDVRIEFRGLIRLHPKSETLSPAEQRG